MPAARTHVELTKSIIGHSSSMDTYGIYGHEIDSERHCAIQIINNVFTDIPEKENKKILGR